MESWNTSVGKLRAFAQISTAELRTNTPRVGVHVGPWVHVCVQTGHVSVPRSSSLHVHALILPQLIVKHNQPGVALTRQGVDNSLFKHSHQRGIKTCLDSAPPYLTTEFHFSI